MTIAPRSRRSVLRLGFATATALAVPAALSGPAAAFRDRDCSDFDTQRQAQRFYKRNKPGDPHGLDADGDGKACESLPRR